MIPSSQAEIARFHAALAAMPQDERPDIDTDMLSQILDAAGRLADEVLAPLDPVADRLGCRIENGRVLTPQGYGAAWQAMAEGGWLGLDQPEEFGGSGLPVTLKAMTTALFDRAGLALGMACGATASASVLLAEHAPRDVASDWIPALLLGERAATICISELEAGSDLGRMRSRATPEGDQWRVTGTKQWISFGDHDLAPRIGHCLLARTGDAPGTRGLSLFLVPSHLEDGTPNNITLVGIEEKLGLHGSPTCALSFDGSKAVLLGNAERGLPQLFTMITMMRLQVACQGLAAAARATDIAEAYAADRRQGGAPTEPPVRIETHPDVRRQLDIMRSRTEGLRAVVLQLAACLDRARVDPEAAALAQFLLPLAKAIGSETGFDVAHAGIQVLGGAGYTRDWPMEQTLRDIRVAAIYEGTTGMQALDFTERRLMREPAGYEAFLRRATGPLATAFSDLVDQVRTAAPDRRQAAADAVLRAGWLAVAEWLAPRLPEDARYCLDDATDLFALHASRARRAL
ncbi:acyl-CoA dehydrogenase family protein [Ponticoccus sp. SC2-23]|uniref:acyl-CoA dehydrogenase family protein n=1 Tax=Alexandriicola marinus TaxID=2081710 RepID=UPI000FDCBF49|nr:acyl-CoA dehydrogenase family protein [Alexandriicola marinus]MBM1221315.1 acyl-CoA dehydrogenase family protein [Ponticoccus sp. SC6-9]MBM1225885.1 acyl-CoA dehydrogenase family protein [Ponticoccus sp. SC6-15]MBM1228037.1 acyl-CoA dehydrogenase family protein [Ponticoccus sp. SC6-38]MBM1234325.1 acyl-CoA dehydrogenase family protein [Ponticoccus sp. SC6-45]MBM1238539.1 acyl-CoA dehydrogenase family protein [Ponticoccus sp. SC6-49]MBM1243808.1 acyl-CoA dehydrogenase family protein [Pontic